MSDGELVYYKSVVANASYSELWRMAGNPLTFAVGVIMKLIGVCPTPPFGLALLNDELIEFADIPDFVWAAVETQLRNLESLGYSRSFAQSIPTVGPATGYSIVLSRADGAVWATIPFAEVQFGGHVSRETGFVLTSLLVDGNFQSTTSLRRRLDGPSRVQTKYLEGASVHALVEEHQSSIADKDVVSIANEQLHTTVTELGKLITRFNIDRGVNVRMSSAEIKRIASSAGGSVSE